MCYRPLKIWSILAHNIVTYNSLKSTYMAKVTTEIVIYKKIAYLIGFHTSSMAKGGILIESTVYTYIGSNSCKIII